MATARTWKAPACPRMRGFPIKHMKPRHITALAAAFALASTAASHGAIIMTITDDGTNLTMRATGSYDNTGLTKASKRLVVRYETFVIPDSGLFGWSGSSSAYEVTVVGSLTGTGNISASSSQALVTTNIPFFIFLNNGGQASISFGPKDEESQLPISGTVDNTTVFGELTLADLGMVAGESLTVTWGTNTATIQTSAIPEPSAALLGLLGAGFLLRRKR